MPESQPNPNVIDPTTGRVIVGVFGKQLVSGDPPSFTSVGPSWWNTSVPSDFPPGTYLLTGSISGYSTIANVDSDLRLDINGGVTYSATIEKFFFNVVSQHLAMPFSVVVPLNPGDTLRFTFSGEADGNDHLYVTAIKFQ